MVWVFGVGKMVLTIGGDSGIEAGLSDLRRSDIVSLRR